MNFDEWWKAQDWEDIFTNPDTIVLAREAWEAGQSYVQSVPSTLNLDGQDFYELCQQYRHSKDIPPHPSLPNVVQAFDNLREYIKTGKLPWPSYERTDEVHGEVKEKP